MIFSFIQIFAHIANKSLEADSALPAIMYTLRIFLSILFPNVTLKRQLFDLRLRSNNYCIDILNNVVKSKQNAADTKSIKTRGIITINNIHTVDF